MGVGLWRGGGCSNCPRLLSLLGACVSAGRVEELQGSGSSERWTAGRRGADRPLTPDTRFWDRRRDGVAVEQPELKEEHRGQLTREIHAGAKQLDESTHAQLV